MKFVTYDGHASELIEAGSRNEAESLAGEFWRDGDWGDGDNWVVYCLAEADEDGEPIEDTHETYNIFVPAPVPDCSHEDGHDFQSPHSIVGGIKENPGVWGNGGGVIITECCMHCGCKKETNTWAQNPIDGSQGHTVASYETRFYELPTEAEQFGEG